MIFEGLNLMLWLIGITALGVVIWCILTAASVERPQQMRGGEDEVAPPVLDEPFHNKGVAHDPANLQRGTTRVFRK